MSEFTSRFGSFTAYLESTQKGKSEAAAAPVSPITVLEILSRQPQRAMAMADLEKLSGMDSTRFRGVLKESGGCGLRYGAGSCAGRGGDIDG